MKDFKLCFVEDNIAYFTNQSLSKQWGDDWNDAPYEHNAGTPYENLRNRILRVYYEARLTTPAYHQHSGYSVEDINKKKAPWLIWNGKEKARLYAGATLGEFINFIEDIGGIYAILK